MWKSHTKQVQDALLEVRISLVSRAVRRNANKDDWHRLCRLTAQRSAEQVAYLEQSRRLNRA